MAWSILHFYFVRTYTNFFKQDETEFSVVPNAMGKFKKTLFLEQIFLRRNEFPIKSCCLLSYFIQTATDESRQDVKIPGGRSICRVSTSHCIPSGMYLLCFYKYTLCVIH